MTIKQTKEELSRLVKFAGAIYEEHFNKAKHILHVLSYGPDILAFDTPSCNHLLENLLANDRDKIFANIGASDIKRRHTL